MERQPATPTEDRPRPVLFASTYINLGGGETSLIEMARHLELALWMPHLLVPASGQLSKLWEREGWPVHVISWRSAMPYFVPALWARLPKVEMFVDLLRREGIAVVHLDYHSMPLLAPACERADVPWLWMCHGWWLRPKPWQRGLFKRARHTFAVSKAANDGFLGDPPFMPPDRVEVQPLGVDSQRFRPDVDGMVFRREFNIPPDAPVITILGRFQPVKGHLTFLQMVSLLADDYPDAQFLVVGDNVLDGAQGDRHHSRVIAAVRSDPVLQKRVTFTGFRADAENVMAATDILVCASDFESFGMVHLEAMASAVPVVSTNRGGPAEIVLDGQTGLLVPPRDPAALAEAVRRLLDDADLRRQMGQAGRVHVVKNLDARHYAARVSEVLDGLICE